jgi:hypothetical protein
MSQTDDEVAQGAIAIKEMQESMNNLLMFSSTINNSIGSIGNNVNILHESYAKTHFQLKEFSRVMDENQYTIKKLEEESGETRLYIDDIFRKSLSNSESTKAFEEELKKNKSASDLAILDLVEKSESNTQLLIDKIKDTELTWEEKLATVSNDLHGELLIERASSKIDLGAINDPADHTHLDETLIAMKELIHKNTESEFSDNLEHEEFKRIAKERILILEKILSLQVSCNEDLNFQIESKDKSIQYIYDDLHEKIGTIEQKFIDINVSNTNLTHKLAEFQKTQDNQTKLMGELLKNGVPQISDSVEAPKKSIEVEEIKEVENIVITKVIENDFKKGHRDLKGEISQQVKEYFEIVEGDKQVVPEEISLDYLTLQESDNLIRRLSAIESTIMKDLPSIQEHVTRLNTEKMSISQEDTINEMKKSIIDLQNELFQFKNMNSVASVTSNVVSDPRETIKKSLVLCHFKWKTVCDTLKNHISLIDTKDTSGKNGPDNITAELSKDKFVSSLRILLTNLEALVPTLLITKGTFDENLSIFYPLLESLSEEANEVLNNNKNNENIQDAVTLAHIDLYRMEGVEEKTKLTELLQDAIESSYPLLDERVDKVTMRRRIKALEEMILTKTDKEEVSEIKQDFRTAVVNKVDSTDFFGALEKKASLTEVMRIKDQILGKIDYLNGIADNKEDNKNAHVPYDPAPLIELTTRFDLVHNQFRDLQKYVTEFVRRDEVEQAMQALLNEVKNIRMNSITPNVLKEGLKLKADAVEMKRLIESLSSAVGDGKSKAAAIHAKCLICDKPVKTLSSKAMSTSQSMTVLPGMEVQGYSKALDGDKPGSRRVSSPDRAVRSSNDISILRSTIDLPPITDEEYARESKSSQGNKPETTYKNRIRSSVGGGGGSNHQENTR